MQTGSSPNTLNFFHGTFCQPGKPLTSATSVRTHLTIPNRTANCTLISDIPSWIERTRNNLESFHLSRCKARVYQTGTIEYTFLVFCWETKEREETRRWLKRLFFLFTPFLFNTIIFRVLEGHIIHTCRQHALCQSNNGCELRRISKISKLWGSKTLDTGTRSHTPWLLSASSYIRAKSQALSFHDTF